jgi:hypothetical protein
LNVSSRASDGDHGQPKSRDGRCQAELRCGLGEYSEDHASEVIGSKTEMKKPGLESGFLLLARSTSSSDPLNCL